MQQRPPRKSAQVLQQGGLELQDWTLVMLGGVVVVGVEEVRPREAWQGVKGAGLDRLNEFLYRQMQKNQFYVQVRWTRARAWPRQMSLWTLWDRSLA